MSCCGQPNICETPCFHGGDQAWVESVVDSIDANCPSSVTLSSVGMRLIDPKIVWTKPEPKKPTIDEMCKAAMVRLKAHIDYRCAEQREIIRANSNWDIGRMHRRHDTHLNRHHLSMAIHELLWKVICAEVGL